jgi:hypothetical protein
MDQQTDTDHDQADEDILAYAVSDDALEEAAGTKRGAATVKPYPTTMFGGFHCC